MPVEGLEQRMYEFIELARSKSVETSNNAQKGQEEGFSKGYWHSEDKLLEKPADLKTSF